MRQKKPFSILGVLAIGLFGIVPASQANSNTKFVKVCNNFSHQNIWVTFQSKAERWKTFEISPGQPSVSCSTVELNKDQWEAGRVYVFDKKPTDADYAIEGSYQLVEFTFRDLGLGYNISNVDSIHNLLPVAVEATGNNGKGYPYTGYVMPAQNVDLTLLKKDFQDFVNAGWPYFTLSSDTTSQKYKIPGGYNLFALSHSVAYNVPADKRLSPENLTARWLKWVNSTTICSTSDAFCKAFQQDVREVWHAFSENAKKAGVNPSAQEMVQHILGYVPFGTNWDHITTDIGQKWIHLAEGIPSTGSYPDKKYPDYHSDYNLDPYVTFIHKTLGLNVYSFSIDDSLGYFDTGTDKDSNGLLIAVGGLNGLINTEQAKSGITPTPPTPAPTSSYHVNMGPGWLAASVCGSNKQDLNTAVGVSLPIIFDITHLPSSCKIVLYAPNESTTSFTVTLNTSSGKEVFGYDPASCVGNVCSGIILNTNTGKDINGPSPQTTPTPPTPSPAPAPSGDYYLYAGPGWNSVKVCGSSTTLNKSAGSAVAFHFNSDRVCHVEYSVDSVVKLAFKLTVDEKGALSHSECGSLCNAIVLNGKNINVPAH